MWDSANQILQFVSLWINLSFFDAKMVWFLYTKKCDHLWVHWSSGPRSCRAIPTQSSRRPSTCHGFAPRVGLWWTWRIFKLWTHREVTQFLSLKMNPGTIRGDRYFSHQAASTRLGQRCVAIHHWHSLETSPTAASDPYVLCRPKVYNKPALPASFRVVAKLFTGFHSASHSFLISVTLAMLYLWIRSNTHVNK